MNYNLNSKTKVLAISLISLIVSNQAIAAKFALPVINSEAEFTKRVLEDPRPAVIKFGAEWCPPCGVMRSALNQVAQGLHSSVNFVEVDTDHSPTLVNRYNIRALPTVVFLNAGTPKKELVDQRITGAGTTKTQLADKIKKVFNLN